MQRVWTSYYYFYWNAYCRSQLKFLTQSYIVWANCIYFYWNEHGLSQLQLFKLESAYSEPIANISTKTCTNWASCNYFKHSMHIFYAKCNYSNWQISMISSEMCIVWASCNDFKWNTNSRSQPQLFQLSPHSLSQLQRFKVKQAYLSREIRTVWANCNYFIWNKHRTTATISSEKMHSLK